MIYQGSKALESKEFSPPLIQKASSLLQRISQCQVCGLAKLDIIWDLYFKQLFSNDLIPCTVPVEPETNI